MRFNRLARMAGLTIALTAGAAASVTARAHAQSFSALYSFTRGNDGANPDSGVVMDAAGNIYGETQNGGQTCDQLVAGCGTVYKIDPSGNETTLIAFSGANGATGNSRLTLIGSTLYGVAIQGGQGAGSSCAYGCGLVFSINTDGSNPQVLHSFSGADGSSPTGTLQSGPNGTLYGVTLYGGAYGNGVLYQISSNGIYTDLHDFNGPTDGYNPNSIALTPSGTILGAVGIFSNPCKKSVYCGRIFAYTPSTATYKVLHAFTGNDGDYPTLGGVAANGAVYGVTEYSGPNNAGTLFSLTPSGKTYKFATLFNFNTSGISQPSGGPAIMPNGAVVGVARSNMIYSYANGVASVMHGFTGGSAGNLPYGSLWVTPGGSLIGTTLQGGVTSPSPGYGVVYSFMP